VEFFGLVEQVQLSGRLGFGDRTKGPIFDAVRQPRLIHAPGGAPVDDYEQKPVGQA
jgi:hypothetical protein